MRLNGRSPIDPSCPSRHPITFTHNENARMKQRVVVCEVGPRDGLQNVEAIIATPDKIISINALAVAGFTEIEVGSFVPSRLVPQMADTPELVEHFSAQPGPKIVVLAPNLNGVRRAIGAGAHRICVPVSVTEGHSRRNLNRTPSEQVDEVRRIAEWIRDGGYSVELVAACSMAFGCSIDGIVPQRLVVKMSVALVEAGAHEVMLADTVGYAHPWQVRSLVRSVRVEIGDRLGGLHLHDTLGLGLANVVAGLEEGVARFDSSVAGLGGCPFAPGASGNAATEDLVFMLESMGIDTGVNLSSLFECRALLGRLLPDEHFRGHVAAAGIPKTFKRALS